MERRVFQRLAFLLLSCAAVTAIALRSQRYPIDIPYAFLVRPGTPEWEELDAAGLARQAVKLPDRLAEQMTSEALFETALSRSCTPYLLMIPETVPNSAAGRCFWLFSRVWKRWLTAQKAENRGLHHKFTKIMQRFPR